MSTLGTAPKAKVGLMTRLKGPSLLRSFLSVGALRVMSLPLTLATAVLLARLLGPEDYGRYAFAISLATLLSLPVGQGITQLLTREIAQGMQEGHPGVHRGILRWAWRRLGFYALVIIPGVGLIWGLCVIGSLAWMVAACLAPLVAAYQVYGGAIRGHDAPVQSQIPEMLARPLGVLALVLMAWGISEVTLVSALALHVIATGFGLWLSWVLYRRLSPPETRSAPPEGDNGAWSRSSLSFIMITASNFMGIEIGILALGLMNLPEQVSGMRIAQSGAQLVMLALVTINLVTQSKIAVLAHEGGGKPLWRAYVRAARLAFGGALMLTLIMVIWREPLVSIAFGQDFVPLVIWPLTILAVMGMINAFFGPSGTLLNMARQEKKSLRAQIIGLMITVAGVLVLAPLYDATGAALAITAGMAAKKIAEAVYVKQHFGVWLHSLSPHG